MNLIRNVHARLNVLLLFCFRHVCTYAVVTRHPRILHLDIDKFVRKLNLCDCLDDNTDFEMACDHNLQVICVNLSSRMECTNLEHT